MPESFPWWRFFVPGQSCSGCTIASHKRKPVWSIPAPRIIPRSDNSLPTRGRFGPANVTSCAFGGPDLRQLFITTAAGPGAEAGRLFTCPAGIAGLPAYPYRG